MDPKKDTSADSSNPSTAQDSSSLPISQDLSDQAKTDSGSAAMPSDQNTGSAVANSSQLQQPVLPGKLSTKGVVIGIAAILVLVFASVAAFYFYNVRSPQNVLMQSLANSFDSQKTKSATFDGTVELTMPGQNTIRANLEGGISDSAADIAVSSDFFGADVGLDVILTEDKKLYAKLDGAGLAESLADGASDSEFSLYAQLYAPIISAMDNKWISFDANSYFGKSSDKLVSADDRKKLAKVYADNPFLVVSNVMDNENIQGVASHHFKVGISPDRLKEFADGLKDSKLSGMNITSEQIDDFKKSVDSTDFSKLIFDVWISKKDAMITQFGFKHDFDDSSSVDAKITISGYNKEVKATAPEDAVTIDEILGSFYE